MKMLSIQNVNYRGIGNSLSLAEVAGMPKVKVPTKSEVNYQLGRPELDKELLSLYDAPEIDEELLSLYNEPNEFDSDFEALLDYNEPNEFDKDFEALLDYTPKISELETKFVDSFRDELFDAEYQMIEEEYGHLESVALYGDLGNENFDNWSDSEIDLLYKDNVDEYDLVNSDLRTEHVAFKVNKQREKRAYKVESAVKNALSEYDLIQSEKESKSLTEQYYNILDEYNALTEWSDAKEDLDLKRMYRREKKWFQRQKKKEISDAYEKIFNKYGVDLLEVAQKPSTSAVYTMFGRVPKPSAVA